MVLNNNFFQNNINKFYTFGMPDEGLVFKDLTNIKIKSLMGLVDISKNLPYLFPQHLTIDRSRNWCSNLYRLFWPKKHHKNQD